MSPLLTVTLHLVWPLEAGVLCFQYSLCPCSLLYLREEGTETRGVNGHVVYTTRLCPPEQAPSAVVMRPPCGQRSWPREVCHGVWGCGPGTWRCPGPRLRGRAAPGPGLRRGVVPPSQEYHAHTSPPVTPPSRNNVVLSLFVSEMC